MRNEHGHRISDLPLIKKGLPPVRPSTLTDAGDLRLGRSRDHRELHETMTDGARSESDAGHCTKTISFSSNLPFLSLGSDLE